MSKLRPNETIHKVLVSTTSRLLGEYESEDLLIAHAWHDFRDPRVRDVHVEGPLSRSAYVVSFETEPYIQEAGSLVPDYSWVGEWICICLSVFYGKRFDSHGLLEGAGLFHLTGFSQFQPVAHPKIPQNNHSPRFDIAIPLDIGEVSKIYSLLRNDLDPKFLRTFRVAGRFYAEALRNFEGNPEISYLNLITAGEVLSNHFDYEKDDLLDNGLKSILSRISSGSDDGPKLAKQIKGRLYQVKSRFLRAMTELLSEPFYSDGEVGRSVVRLGKDDIRDRLGAAYDLRSKYVHSGYPFGAWVSRMAAATASEVQISTPQVGDKDFERVLYKAPTYFGLERVIRYSLLRFIHKNGTPIDARLD